MHLETVSPGDEPGALPLLLCCRSMYGRYTIKLIRLGWGATVTEFSKKAPNVLVGDMFCQQLLLWLQKHPKTNVLELSKIF